MDTLTNLTQVTEQGHDTAGAIALAVLVAVCLVWWAAAEGLLARSRRRYQDQTAIARTVGVLRDQHDTAYDGEFADQVAQRLAERGDAS